jgi:hypothetical protein
MDVGEFLRTLNRDTPKGTEKYPGWVTRPSDKEVDGLSMRSIVLMESSFSNHP